MYILSVFIYFMFFSIYTTNAIKLKYFHAEILILKIYVVLLM